MVTATASSPCNRPPRHPHRDTARSCRLLALEIRLALAAGGWVEGEEAVAAAWPARRAAVAPACSASPTASDSAGVAGAASRPSHAVDDAEADWDACVRRAGWTRTTPGAAADGVDGPAAPSPATGGAATATGGPHHHGQDAHPSPSSCADARMYADAPTTAPWQAAGRDAAWTARLAGLAGGGGRRAAAACVQRVAGGGAVDAACDAARPQHAPGTTHHPSSEQDGRQGGETQQFHQRPASLPPTGSPSAGYCRPLSTAPDGGGDPLRAGFDLAIQALLDARAARWG
jgi:hypothetical protein